MVVEFITNLVNSSYLGYSKKGFKILNTPKNRGSGHYSYKKKYKYLGKKIFFVYVFLFLSCWNCLEIHIFVKYVWECKLGL